MKKHKILYDLILSNINVPTKLSGIPVDTRFLFSQLGKSPKIQIEGLIRPFLIHFPINKLKLDTIFGQSLFLGNVVGPKKNQNTDITRGITNKLFGKGVQQIYITIKNLMSHSVKHFPVKENDMFLNMIWRNFFAMTLEAKERNSLLQLKYRLSKLSDSKIHVLLSLFGKRCKIDTKDYDFLLTQDIRAFRTHPKTKHIIRYHDGLPILGSDTMSYKITISHYKRLISCSKDQIYVCNSPNSLNELHTTCPQAAKKAVVIPCFIPRMKRVQVNADTLINISLHRISRATVGTSNQNEVIKRWFSQSDIYKKNTGKIPKFIMALATIEPRKNYKLLIEAWNKLCFETQKDIKLMIVGTPGWLYKSTLENIRPFSKMGRILHLQNVSQTELPYLYSAANCFISPSFAEGFGIPPIEAMQCGCPTLVSDLPAHRYSAGSSSLFFDPYDIDDLFGKMKSIVCTSKDAPLRKELIKKGFKNIERYSTKNILAQWEELFDKLSCEK